MTAIGMEALLGASIGPDGEARIGLLTDAGAEITLSLPPGSLPHLLMLVLGLLGELERRQSGDRIVHPVAAWRLDPVSARDWRVLTLETVEGVRLPFLIGEADLRSIGMAVSAAMPPTTARTH